MTSRRSGGPRGQRGAVLLAALTATLLAGTSFMLARMENTAGPRARESAVTARALADAKRAIVGWSVAGGIAGDGTEHPPGLLPFPDRNNDAGGYDGRADCVTHGLSDRHLIGRLPRAGETSPCPGRALGVELRGGSGEPLWYAVSRNLVNYRGGSSLDPPINPGLLDATPAYPWIRLIDMDGATLIASDGDPLEIAAVIIAPGPPLAGQTRSGAAPGAAEYLDSVAIDGVSYDNADSDGCRDAIAGASAYMDCPGRTGEEFILYPDSRGTASATDSFNDRIAWVTAEELLRAAEARALGTLTSVLERYRSRHGAYPWEMPAARGGDAGVAVTVPDRDGAAEDVDTRREPAAVDTPLTLTGPGYDLTIDPAAVPRWFVNHGWFEYVHDTARARLTTRLADGVRAAGSPEPGS